MDEEREIVFKDGNKYKGQFKNDKINGYGEMEYENGDRYLG